MTFDLAFTTPHFVAGLNNPVCQSLMVAFVMKMRKEIEDSSSQRMLAEKDHAVDTFLT